MRMIINAIVLKHHRDAARTNGRETGTRAFALLRLISLGEYQKL